MIDNKRWVVGEFVETVQLQVVCQTLISKLSGNAREITVEHLAAYGDIDSALRVFYEDSLREAVEKTRHVVGPRGERRVTEGLLRNWFEKKLITPAETRGLAYRSDEETEGLANEAVDVLDRSHIIREERRGVGRWYELSHDRFIYPIKESNKDWLLQYSGAVKTRQWLEEAAARWARTQDDQDLLDESQLPEAERWLASPEAAELGYDHAVDAFVRESRGNIRNKEERHRLIIENAQRVARGARRLRWAVVFLTVVSLLAIASTVYAYYSRGEAERAKDEAEFARGLALASRDSADRMRDEAEAAKNSEAAQRQRAEEQATRAEEQRAVAEAAAALAARSAREAEEAKNKEVVAKQNAERQAQLAAAKAREAVEAKLEAVQQREEADRAGAEALWQKNMAERQRQAAEAQKNLAEAARKTDKLYREAFNLARSGSKKEAVEKFNQALDIYSKPNEQGEPYDRQAMIDTRVNVGAIYLDLDDDTKAGKYFNDALTAALDDQKPSILMVIGDNYSDQSSYSGRRQKAFTFYQKALDLYVAGKDKASAEVKGKQAGVWKHIADTHKKMGDAAPTRDEDQFYRKALEAYEQAIQLYGEANELRRGFEALLAAGSLTQRLDKQWKVKGTALRYFEHALDSADGPTEKITALKKVIEVRRTLGQWRAADEDSERIIKLYQEIEDKAGEAQANFDIGRPYMESDRDYIEEEPRPTANNAKAVAHLKRAALLFAEAGQKERSAQTLLLVGAAYGKSESGEAIKAFKAALNIYVELKAADDEVTTLHRLAVLEAEAGNTQEAKANLERAEQSLVCIVDPSDQIIGLSYIGSGYLALRDLDAATVHFGKALNMARAGKVRFITEGAVHRYLGFSYAKYGFMKQATKHLTDALNLARASADVGEEAETLSRFGGAYEENKDYKQALAYYGRAAERYRSAGSLNDQARQLRLIARMYRKRGDTKSAEDYERRAVEAIKPPPEEPRPPHAPAPAQP